MASLVGQKSSSDSTEEQRSRFASKLSRRKRHNMGVARVLMGMDRHHELGVRIARCGLHLVIRQYEEDGRCNPVGGEWCNKHMLCAPCAWARSRRLCSTYWPRVLEGVGRKAEAFHLTLSWPHGGSPVGVPWGQVALKELQRGFAAWQALWSRQKVRHTGPLRNVLGAIVAAEITARPSWLHPHFHCLVMCRQGCWIDARELRDSWEQLTCGRQMKLERIRDYGGILEVLKYSVKPSGVGDTSRITAIADAQAWFRGLRLIRSYGTLYGPEDSEEPLSGEIGVTEFGEYHDWLTRWQVDAYGPWVRVGKVWHDECA